jgi:hypothetical protein
MVEPLLEEDTSPYYRLWRREMTELIRRAADYFSRDPPPSAGDTACFQKS